MSLSNKLILKIEEYQRHKDIATHKMFCNQVTAIDCYNKMLEVLRDGILENIRDNAADTTTYRNFIYNNILKINGDVNDNDKERCKQNIDKLSFKNLLLISEYLDIFNNKKYTYKDSDYFLHNCFKIKLHILNLLSVIFFRWKKYAHRYEEHFKWLNDITEEYGVKYDNCMDFNTYYKSFEKLIDILIEERSALKKIVFAMERMRTYYMKIDEAIINQSTRI